MKSWATAGEGGYTLSQPTFLAVILRPGRSTGRSTGPTRFTSGATTHAPNYFISCTDE